MTASGTKEKKKRRLHGVVVRRSGDKTVAVEVTVIHQHAKYSKTLQTRRRYLVHDPKNALSVGEAVTIEASRPFSRKKHWVVAAPVTRK